MHTQGLAICDLTLDTVNRNVFVLSFNDQILSMVSYDEEGNLELTDTYTFTDPGSYESGYSDVERQSVAYPHGVGLMPDGDHVCVCNMGADKIYVFAIDHENNTLELCPELTVQTDAGEGPRHIVFSSDGAYAYMNTEMGNTVYVFEVGEDSSLTMLQKVSTLNPEEENSENGGWASVTVISSDDQYLYVGNRGQNNIAAFAIGEDGLLTSVGYFDCYGESPRGLSLGYNEEVLIVSCNTSGTISVIERDTETGELGACLQLIEDIPGSANVAWGTWVESE